MWGWEVDMIQREVKWEGGVGEGAGRHREQSLQALDATDRDHWPL